MWASQALLAKDCKLSSRSVREKLQSLSAKGLLKRVKRPGTSDYCVLDLRVLTLAESAAPPVLTLAESAAHPGEICLSPRQDLPTTPAKSAAYLPKELPNELPNELPTIEKSPDDEQKTAVSDVWQTINEIMGRSGYLVGGAKPLKLTQKRREAIKARLKEHGEDALFDVVSWYHNSSHPRAVFLREKGYTIDTVLQRSKFDQYATMSELPEGSITDTNDPLSVLGAARKLRLEEGQ